MIAWLFVIFVVLPVYVIGRVFGTLWTILYDGFRDGIEWAIRELK